MTTPAIVLIVSVSLLVVLALLQGPIDRFDARRHAKNGTPKRLRPWIIIVLASLAAIVVAGNLYVYLD